VNALPRVAWMLLALFVGALIGLTGGFVQAHRSVWTFDGRYLVIPWGVVIVVVVLVVSIRAAAKVTGKRAAAWLLLAGWLAMTIFLASETRYGDIAVSSGVRQWGYLLAGTVIGSAIATFPPTPVIVRQGNQASASRVPSP